MMAVLLWMTVFATREGLVGQTTASGHVIKSQDIFVALPTRTALGKTVEVYYNGITIQCKVKDVGPWSTGDTWIFTGNRPLAETGKRIPEIWLTKYGKPKNKAGIDLSDGLWDALNIPRGKGIVKVKVRLVK